MSHVLYQNGARSSLFSSNVLINSIIELHKQVNPNLTSFSPILESIHWLIFIFAKSCYDIRKTQISFCYEPGLRIGMYRVVWGVDVSTKWQEWKDLQDWVFEVKLQISFGLI